MTTLTGPINVKRGPLSEDYQTVIGASGTASFDGAILVSGTAHFKGGIMVSATAIFQGPVRVGAAAAAPGANAGFALVTQRATLGEINSAANPVSFTIPSGSDLINFLVTVEVPFASGVVTAGEVVGHITSDATAGGLIFILPVSASGQYRPLSTSFVRNANLQRNITTNIRVFVSAQSTDSAFTSGQAMLTCTYLVK